MIERMAISCSKNLLFAKAFCGSTGGGDICNVSCAVGTTSSLDNCSGMGIGAGRVAVEDSGG